MTGSWRARCLIDGCPWKASGDGPDLLGRDAVSAHAWLIHRRAT